MAPGLPKKRKVLDGLKGQPKKKFRKQRQYHSSSDEASEDDDNEPSDFQAVSLADSDAEDEPAPSKSAKPSKPTKKSPKQKTQDSDKNSTPSEDDDEPDLDNVADDNDDNDDDLSDDDDDDASLNSEEEEEDGEAGAEAGGRAVPKRHDPSAFSNSIAKILMTKLPTSARADPVLSRSKDVAQSRTDFKDEKLDQQARAKLRAEKKEELDRGRVRDVMGVQGGAAGLVAEEEKRLRKVAQRGVVKLFNAVRAAQVRGEEAAKSERKKGTVGMGEREKAVNEVSKQGFLDLISGKKGKPLNIEEA